MKVSELCAMIEGTIRSGRYPFDSETQKRLSSQVTVRNKSATDDLHADGIQVETRVDELFVLNNYIQQIEHLPGVIELDAIDSFKIICRKLDRIKAGIMPGRL